MSVGLSFPVATGLLSPHHREKIGGAIWEFLWLIDKTTHEKIADGQRLGIVLGGKLIEVETIAASLGVHTQTVRKHLRRLEEGGYIEITRTRDGQRIAVRKSIKWLWRSEKNVRKQAEHRPQYPSNRKQSQTILQPSQVDWDAEKLRGL